MFNNTCLPAMPNRPQGARASAARGPAHGANRGSDDGKAERVTAPVKHAAARNPSLAAGLQPPGVVRNTSQVFDALVAQLRDTRVAAGRSQAVQANFDALLQSATLDDLEIFGAKLFDYSAAFKRLGIPWDVEMQAMRGKLLLQHPARLAHAPTNLQLSNDLLAETDNAEDATPMRDELAAAISRLLALRDRPDITHAAALWCSNRLAYLRLCAMEEDWEDLATVSNHPACAQDTFSDDDDAAENDAQLMTSGLARPFTIGDPQAAASESSTSPRIQTVSPRGSMDGHAPTTVPGLSVGQQSQDLAQAVLLAMSQHLQRAAQPAPSTPPPLPVPHRADETPPRPSVRPRRPRTVRANDTHAASDGLRASRVLRPSEQAQSAHWLRSWRKPLWFVAAIVASVPAAVLIPVGWSMFSAVLFWGGILASVLLWTLGTTAWLCCGRPRVSHAGAVA